MRASYQGSKKGKSYKARDSQYKPRLKEKSREKCCTLGKQAGRSVTKHFMSTCKFLPEFERKFMTKTRQVNEATSSKEEESEEVDSESDSEEEEEVLVSQVKKKSRKKKRDQEMLKTNEVIRLPRAEVMLWLVTDGATTCQGFGQHSTVAQEKASYNYQVFLVPNSGSYKRDGFPMRSRR